MDSEAHVDARHSWNHTRRFVHATYLGLLSHTPPAEGANYPCDCDGYHPDTLGGGIQSPFCSSAAASSLYQRWLSSTPDATAKNVTTTVTVTI